MALNKSEISGDSRTCANQETGGNRDFHGVAEPDRGCAEHFVRVLSTPAIAIVLWCFAGLVIAGRLASLPQRATRWDFSHYYLSALELREGANPYLTDFTEIGQRLRLEVGDINHATYPPTFLVFFEPLTLLSPAHAYWIWMGLSFAALLVSFYLLGIEARLPYPLSLSLIPLALLYEPLWDNIKFAQCQILLLLLLALMLRCMRTGRERTAGVMLALAIVIRVFPIFIVGYLFVRRKWRALGWALATAVAVCAVVVAEVGLSTSLSFLGQLGFLTGPQWLQSAGNIAESAVVLRLFSLLVGSTFSRHTWLLLRVTQAGVVLVTLLITAKASSYHARSDRDQDEWVFSLWVITTIMVAPTAWAHYLVLLYLPFAFIAGAASRSTIGRRTLFTGLASYVGASYFSIVLLPIRLLPIPGVEKWFAPVVSETLAVFLVLAYISAYSLVSEARFVADQKHPKLRLQAA